MAKLSLQELALQLTNANLVKSRTAKKSINSYLVELLKDGDYKTRIDLTNEITLLRIQEKEEVTAESFHDPEFIARFSKMNRTVKNGLDTSIAKGKSTSCFCSSDYASEWELIHNLDKTYSMISLVKPLIEEEIVEAPKARGKKK